MFSTENSTHGKKNTSGATGKGISPQFPTLSKFYTVSFSKLLVRTIYELLIAITYCALTKKKGNSRLAPCWHSIFYRLLYCLQAELSLKLI